MGFIFELWGFLDIPIVPIFKFVSIIDCECVACRVLLIEFHSLCDLIIILLWKLVKDKSSELSEVES